MADVRARNDHALVDMEAVRADPGLVRQIGSWQALAHPALQQVQHGSNLAAGEACVEKCFGLLRRQVERMAHQVERFVERVVGTVPVGQTRLVEARDAEAEQITHRAQPLERLFVLAFQGHRVGPLLHRVVATARPAHCIQARCSGGCWTDRPAASACGWTRDSCPWRC